MRRLACSVFATLCLFFADVALAQADPQATVFPASVDVGDIQEGFYGRASAKVILTNTGTVDLTVHVVYPDVGDPAGFKSMVLNCYDTSGDFSVTEVLKAGAACVTFVEVSRGQIVPVGSRGPGSAVVFYVLNGGQLRLPVTVRWNAVATYLETDATYRTIEQQIGGVSPTFTNTLKNNTPQPLDVLVELLVGFGPNCGGHVASELCLRDIEEQKRSLPVSSDGCHPIPAFGSCEIAIQFRPTLIYRTEATIHVSVPANPAVVPLEWRLSATGIPHQTNPNTVLAIEYSGAGYFITAAPGEISLLDSGRVSGWTRTGKSFWVFPADAPLPDSARPVCRFFGRPEAGLSAHFYSASPAECAEVVARFPDAWIIESLDVFGVYLPDLTSGTCPIGTTPVYRLFDNQAYSDHRYTTDPQIRASAISGGWISEGYGTLGVAMCAPM